MASQHEERIETVTRHATMALLLYGSLHALALAATFWRELHPWNVRVAIATASCLLAYLAAWMVWRSANVASLVIGVIAVLGSLSFLAFPFEWGVAAGLRIALTALCLAPIVRAIVVALRSAR